MRACSPSIASQAGDFRAFRGVGLTYPSLDRPKVIIPGEGSMKFGGLKLFRIVFLLAIVRLRRCLKRNAPIGILFLWKLSVTLRPSMY